MPIIISNIRVSADKNYKDNAFSNALSLLKVKNDEVCSINIYKRSLDARKRTDISYVVSVIVSITGDEEGVVRKVSSPNVKLKVGNEFRVDIGDTPLNDRVVVVGFGPCGIFAAYLLALKGYRPVVIERGGAVEDRATAVERFWSTGELNNSSNVQFGEGGAGTFSDGKLTTRISDPLCEFVLQKLVEFGAPQEVLSTAKPHIGTDKLRDIIKTIREEIITLGGEIHFNTTLTDITIKNSAVTSVTTDRFELQTSNLLLCIGHSARDTFRMLLQNGVTINSKPFSVGFRIEHLQERINYGLYGEYANKLDLPQGEYQLSHRRGDRCVYTFCMCPGGYVVPSSSCEQTVVTNGMSEHSRNGRNANSAIVVSVDRKDFGDNPLDGMLFQEKLEQRAFKLGGGGYKAPATTVGDFLKGENKFNVRSVVPSYSIGVTPVSGYKLYNTAITDMLKLGLFTFNGKIRGFSAEDAILTGVETRTSSPIRIERNEMCESVSTKGLYPCGEGAGYAGGIVSSAVDGLRVAISIISRFKPE